MNNVHLIDHPLVQHKLTLMRRADLSTNSFRRLLKELAMLMTYEVTRDIPTQTIEIETTSGTATADVLPGRTDTLTLIDYLFSFGAQILFGIDFATCAADPDEVIAEMVAPNTALSLDGRAKAGQSIGQHVCTG